MLPSFLVAGSEQVLCSVPDKFNANEHVFLLLLRAEMFSSASIGLSLHHRGQDSFPAFVLLSLPLQAAMSDQASA